MGVVWKIRTYDDFRFAKSTPRLYYLLFHPIFTHSHPLFGLVHGVFGLIISICYGFMTILSLFYANPTFFIPVQSQAEVKDAWYVMKSLVFFGRGPDQNRKCNLIFLPDFYYSTKSSLTSKTKKQ